LELSLFVAFSIRLTAWGKPRLFISRHPDTTGQVLLSGPVLRWEDNGILVHKHPPNLPISDPTSDFALFIFRYSSYSFSRTTVCANRYFISLACYSCCF